MPVIIREIVTEVALAAGTPESPGAVAGASAPGLSAEDLDLVVRRCTERVLETLRREWDQ